MLCLCVYEGVPLAVRAQLPSLEGPFSLQGAAASQLATPQASGAGTLGSVWMGCSREGFSEEVSEVPCGGCAGESGAGSPRPGAVSQGGAPRCPQDPGRPGMLTPDQEDQSSGGGTPLGGEVRQRPGREQQRWAWATWGFWVPLEEQPPPPLARCCPWVPGAQQSSSL